MSSHGLAQNFSTPVYSWLLLVGSRLGQRISKRACLVVPPLFRADSGTNLIKQREYVKGQPSGSVAQLVVSSQGKQEALAVSSHGKQEALGSSAGRATIFSFPVTLTHPPNNKKIGYSTDVLRQNACLVVNPIKVQLCLPL